MSSNKRAHFRAPEQLIEQADVLATAEDRDRTDVLIDALRNYLSESIQSDEVKRDLANAYYEGTVGYSALSYLDCIYNMRRGCISAVANRQRNRGPSPFHRGRI